jgi:ABC-type Fe3+/spermidine/putrescine transport system ATPase subunit
VYIGSDGSARLRPKQQNSPSNEQTALRLDGVSKEFNGVPAVDAVNLEVERGEIFTLLGSSGCGKTTILRMIAGLEHPDSGEIWLRGRLVASASKGVRLPPNKRNLGMVFQSYAIWPHMTVFDNAAYPLRLRHMPRSDVRERVSRVLDLVGLGGLEERQATALSGGQQQRLALSRSLVYEPDVLLLDEPFSNLDAKLREQMRLELKVLHQRLDVTVLFVTHDQVEALSLSDRIAVMSDGRAEQIGSPRELYEHPQTAYVRDFVGQTVLLSGVIREVGATGDVTVSLAHGPAVRGRSAPSLLLDEGRPVTVAIRPEAIRVATNGDANTLEAAVEAALFVGDRYQVSAVLPDGAHLLLQLPASDEWSPGRILHLLLPSESITVWPAS